MTSLLFDTNALIYWIHPDSSFHEEALCLVEEAYINRSTICALSSSLNDVYYILCRHYMTAVSYTHLTLPTIRLV